LRPLRQRWPGINSHWKATCGTGGDKPPVITGVQGHLKNIDTNTKATANNTKKIGPGDIVFKNLPRALALRGAYQEARVIPQPVPRVSAAAAGGVLSVPTATQGRRLRRSLRRRVLRRSSSWSLTTSVNARIRSLKKWCATPCAMQWPAPAKLTVVHSAIGSKEVFMMMVFGMFVFTLRTVPYQQLRHSQEWRHVKNDRVNQSAAWQYIGPGDDTITLDGVLYPEITGGRWSLSALETIGFAGRPWPLIEGDGQIYGMYVMTRLERGKRSLIATATPKRLSSRSV
jgi:phage protein U